MFFHPSIRRLAPVLLLAAGAVPALIAPAAYAAAQAIHLVHGNPRGYPFQEPPPFPAGDYFALQCKAGCVLKKAGLSVTPAPIASHEGPAPGYKVRSHGGAPSLFLVRGLRGLKEGPVTTWYFNERFQRAPMEDPGTDLTQPQHRSFDAGGTALDITGLVSQVEEEHCRGSAGCPVLARVEWTFRSGGREHSLAVLGGDHELQAPIAIADFIVWIGDLDRDGKPDLVVRPQDRNDYLEMALFLSTGRAPGKPWLPAATFYYWDPANPGC